MMEKLIKNGQVAVVYSPGFGAGWSTWNGDQYAEFLCMDRRIAEAVLSGDRDLARQIAEREIDEYVCTLGYETLSVQWIDECAQFRVEEYDGSESIVLADEYQWLTA